MSAAKADNIAILRCPFCGWRAPRLRKINRGGGWSGCVVCAFCQARGPVIHDPAERIGKSIAVNEWNRAPRKDAE